MLKTRERMYYVIVMPTSLDGTQAPVNTTEGPCILTWEVWDQTCDTFGRFEYLADAIDQADALNLEYETL